MGMRKTRNGVRTVPVSVVAKGIAMIWKRPSAMLVVHWGERGMVSHKRHPNPVASAPGEDGDGFHDLSYPLSPYNTTSSLPSASCYDVVRSEQHLKVVFSVAAVVCKGTVFCCPGYSPGHLPYYVRDSSPTSVRLLHRYPIVL